LSPIASTCLSLGIGDARPGDATIICGAEGHPIVEDKNVLHIHIPHKSKLVTIMTRTLFPETISFALKRGILNHSRISITATDLSRQTLDLSIAITLVLLCLFFDDKGISLAAKHGLMKALWRIGGIKQ
jgi:hypothetical protein